MKTQGLLILCLLFEGELFAHEQIVHQAITVHAAASALNESPAFSDFINTISLDLDLKDATNSMAEGSFDEDFGAKEDSIGGYRSLNHFYDPITKLGLSENPIIKNFVTGQNSYVWASVSNCPGINSFLGSGKSNIWSWQNGRGYEWIGLTAADRLDRNAALNDMFRAVGQVVHLLEDTTQPQHVRNEQHLVYSPWQSPIEIYGKKNRTNLNYQHAVLPWKEDGFTKLQDFWDRGKYTGSDSVALNADANVAGASSDRLGLAEFSNGNFLGDRHRYGDYYAARAFQQIV